MVISPIAFAAGLYQEHLEEISFLYAQRLALLDDPQIQWPDIGDFENRLEAHLDALVVGEQSAMDTGLKKALAGDSGECYGALRLLCRQKRSDLVKPILAGLAATDREKVMAAGDALKVEMPAQWVAEMMDFVKEAPSAAPIVAKTLGFRRFKPSGGGAELLAVDSDAVCPEVIWALGRIRDNALRTMIQPFLGHPDLAIASDAALALMRIGEADTLDICLSKDQDLAWSLIPLGIGGSSRHLARIAGQADSPDALIALGLLGHIGAVATLLGKLEDHALKAYAAMALQLITGANIYESVFIPEPVDEDELTPEELEKHRRGEPVHSAGEAPGQTLTRLSEQSDHWESWWLKNQSAFRKDIRYRSGEAYSPSVLVDMLAAGNSPRLFRQMAYEELVVRYGADFAFETDMPVADQLNAIAAYRSWVAGQKDHFDHGKWYFSGRILA